ncbi:MAG: hypothetical protein HY318_03980 [Armatimonadetes bacterium]|nr:hypothetical protein [Armatimonadota bacterium]
MIKSSRGNLMSGRLMVVLASTSVGIGTVLIVVLLPALAKGRRNEQITMRKYWRDHPERPRSFFGPQDVSVLRSRIKVKPLSLMWPVLKQRCEGYVTPGDPSWVDWRERKQGFWHTRDGVWRLAQCLPDLAIAYRLNGEQRFGECARDITLTIIKENVEGKATQGQVYGQSYGGWGLTDGGFVHQGMAITFDLTYDLMSEEDRQLVANHLLKFARRVFVDAALRPTAPDDSHFPSNQSVYPLCFGAVCALTAYGDAAVNDEELEEWVGYAVQECDNYLQVQVDEDGAAFEGPGYADTITMICQLGYLMRRAGFTDDLLSRDRLKKTTSFFLHVILPGGGDIRPLGQCFNRMAGDSLVARACADKDSHAQYAWLRYMAPEQPEKRLKDAASWGYLSFVWYDPDLRPASNATMKRVSDACFRGMGLLDVRTGWKAKDFHFCMTAGSGFCGGCPDKGSFTLEADGERYAVDIGYGALTADKHCSLLIDGKGPQLGVRIRERMAEQDLAHPHCKFARMDLTRSYSGSQRVCRSVAVVKPARAWPWYVVVADDLRMPVGQHEFEWLLVSGQGNRIIAEAPNLIRIVGKAHSVGLRILSPDKVEPGVDVIEHRYMHEQSKTPTSEPGDFPRLRVRAHGTQGRFLIVMYPWERPPAEIQSTDTETGHGVNLKWGTEVHTLRFKRDPNEEEPSWSFARTQADR